MFRTSSIRLLSAAATLGAAVLAYGAVSTQPGNVLSHTKINSVTLASVG